MCKSHILYSLHALCTSGDLDYTLCQHLVGDGTKSPQIQWKYQLHQSLTHQESPMNCLLGQPATHRTTTSFVWQLPITCPASVQIDIMHGTIAKNHKPHSSKICWTFECRFAWYSLAWVLNPKWVQFWLGKNVEGVVLLPSLQQEMLEQFRVCHQWCPLDVLLNTLHTSLLNSCIVGYLILWPHLKAIPVKWELCMNPIKLEPKPSPWSGENSPIRVLNSILLVNNSPEPCTQKNYPSKSARVRARIQVQIYVVDIIRRASQVSSFMIPKSIMHPLSIDKIVIQSAWQGRRTFHLICDPRV